jgi:hypothetical protein
LLWSSLTLHVHCLTFYTSYALVRPSTIFKPNSSPQIRLLHWQFYFIIIIFNQRFRRVLPINPILANVIPSKCQLNHYWHSLLASHSILNSNGPVHVNNIVLHIERLFNANTLSAPAKSCIMKAIDFWTKDRRNYRSHKHASTDR